MDVWSIIFLLAHAAKPANTVGILLADTSNLLDLCGIMLIYPLFVEQGLLIVNMRVKPLLDLSLNPLFPQLPKAKSLNLFEFSVR
jgi:hypothetical protein